MESSKLLTGRELVEGASFKVGELIPVKGVKEVIPNGSWIQGKQIENSLEALKSLLHHPRIEKRGSLSKAEWLHNLDKALVTEAKGSYWLHIGHVEDQKTYIYPEEALHLMEMNSLELKYGGILMSIQQAYSLLIGKSVSPDEYRVYSLLSKQGYKLLRYNKDRKYCLSEDSTDFSGDEDMEASHCKDSEDIEEKPNTKPNEESMDAMKSDGVIVNNYSVNDILEGIEKAADDLVNIDSIESSKTIASSDITDQEVTVINSSDLSIMESNNSSKNVGETSGSNSVLDPVEKEMELIHEGFNSSRFNDKLHCLKSSETHDEVTLDRERRNVSQKGSLNVIELDKEISKGLETVDADKDNQDSLVSNPNTENSVELPSSTINSDKDSRKNDSINVIDVDSYDNIPTKSDKIASFADTANSNAPVETIIPISIDKGFGGPNSMCVDSSSDDCLIVDEASKTNANLARTGQKRTSTDENMTNSRVKFAKNSNRDRSEVATSTDNNANRETEVIDMDEVSIIAKLKILQSIVNCYKKDTVFVRAPDKDFIPVDINLAKISYSVRLDKFSSKNDIPKDNIENRQPVSYGNRAHLNSSRFMNNSSQMPFNFSHNQQYWSHILHQLRMQSQNSNFVTRLNVFGGDINAFNNSRDPRLHVNAQFAAPFSQQMFQFTNNQTHLDFNHRNISFWNSNTSISQNEPPPVFYNANIRNHVNKANAWRQNQSNNRNRRKGKHRVNKFSTRSYADCGYYNENQSISRTDAKKKLKDLMATYNFMSEDEKSFELANTLKKAIVAYNTKFKENFVVKYEENLRYFSIIPTQKEKIDQLSTISDTDDLLICTGNNFKTSNRRVKKKTRHELNQRRQNNASLCLDDNDTDSTESDCYNVEDATVTNKRMSDICNSDNAIASTSVEVNKADVSCIIPDKLVSDNSKNVQSEETSIINRLIKDGKLESWCLNNSLWNKPEISTKKLQSKRIAFTNINLSTAYLRNIKELSYNVELSVNSWRQAKQLYENDRISKIVCVSDEDMSAEENVPGDVMTVVTGKTVPLVRPQDCQSVETVLKRMQIVKSYSDVTDDDKKAELTDLKICYDVYAPNFKTLQKSRLPSPNYSIIVLSHSSDLPTPVELSKVSSSLPTDVPFLFAVVSFDAVSFIQMENVDLPTLARKNNAYKMNF